jgi:hypothetical protein
MRASSIRFTAAEVRELAELGIDVVGAKSRLISRAPWNRGSMPLLKRVQTCSTGSLRKSLPRRESLLPAEKRRQHYADADLEAYLPRSSTGPEARVR